MLQRTPFFRKLFHIVIFLLLIWLMFFCTFALGKYPHEGILWLLNRLNQYLGTVLTNGVLYDFISNGVVNGVGNVLAFLPNILILFFFMYMFEESGYLTHVADLLDHLMHRIGLHGNSVVPLLMGFGCNVPAILATRTIPETKRRILTMLLIPFMSCSARLPVLVLLVGTFFPQNSILVIFGLYGFTIIMAILTAFFLDRVFFKNEVDLTPVVVLPLKKPKVIKVLKLTWDAGYEYLKKIGTVVLIAMMAIWFLNHFPQQQTTQAQDTYLARFGHFIEPALRPLGFDWKMSVCLTTGLAAKEFIVGSMAILYADHADTDASHIGEHLKNESVFTTPVALSFLIFSMLYMPCIATIYTIKRESGSWKWALFSMGYSIALAWMVALAVFNISSFIP